MTTPIVYHWSTPPEPDRAFMRSMLPQLTGREPAPTIEAAIRAKCWRELGLWTGIDDPAVFPPNDQTVGIRLLQRIQANKSLNGGMGPTVSCGTAANVYISLCAAFGIWARKVIATDASGNPDHTAEFWNPILRGWVHVLPHCNGHFDRLHPQRQCSYLYWSRLARIGDAGSWAYQSPTGGKPIHPRMDIYAGWPGFYDSAVVMNGNGVIIDGQSPVQLIQVWRSQSGKGQWNGGLDAVTPADVYPDMTNF